MTRSALYSEINGFVIGLEVSRRKLESAKNIHDGVLAEQGPYGPSHRCHLHPLAINRGNNITRKNKLDSINYILGRDMVYSLSVEEQIYRKFLGRQNWTRPNVAMNLTTSSGYVAMQTDLLCQGHQLRVNIIDE